MAGPGAVRVLQARFTGDTTGLVKSAATAQTTIGKIAKLTVGAGLAATGGLLVVGNTFDKMTDKITTGTGASGKALERLRKSALNVGKTTPASFEDIGTAIADVNTRLGLTGKPLETISAKFLNLSRITGTDLSDNIKNTTRVFGDWGIQVKDQAGALDKIFAASQKTGIGIDQLTKGVVQFGAPLRQLGFGFEESIALFSKWEQEGVNTNAVMAGMKIGLGNLAKAGEDPPKALARISKEIKNAGTAGKANAIAVEAFGTRAGPDMAAAIREGRFEIGDLVKSLKNSGGALDDAEKKQRSFGEQWKLFINNVMIRVEPLATKMFAALTTGMQWINNTGVPALESMAKWLKENQGWLVPLAAGFGALGAAIGVASVAQRIMMAGGMIKWIKTMITTTKLWTAAQRILNVVMRANPLGIIITILFALGVALVTAYKKSETFRKIVQGVWRGIKTAAGAAWGFIKKQVLDRLVAGLQWVGRTARNFREMVTGQLRTLGNAAATVAKWIKANTWDRLVAGLRWVQERAGLFRELVVARIRAMGTSLANIARWIKRNTWDRFVAGLTWVRERVGAAKDKILAVFRNLRKSIGEIFSSAIEKIKQPIRSVFRWINDNIISGLNKVTKKFGLTVDPLPEKFHKGGEIPGQGERIITALAGEGVVSREGMRNIGGKKGLTAIEKMAHGGPSLNPLDWGKELVDKVGGWLKKGVAWAGQQFFNTVAIPGAKAALSGRVEDVGVGWLKTMRGAIKDWGAEQDRKEAASLRPGKGGGKIAKSGWARPIGSGYSIGRGSAAHGYLAQDLPAPGGTPIYAMNRGYVTGAYDLATSYGRHVMIQHPGVMGVYAHMSRRAVGKGASVNSGQNIGWVDSTGNSTGNHLHVETRGYDPLSFLRARGVRMDHGGWVPPGPFFGVNDTGRPEHLVNADDIPDRPVQVRVFIGDRELTDIVRVEVKNSDNAAAADLYGRGMHP